MRRRDMNNKWKFTEPARENELVVMDDVVRNEEDQPSNNGAVCFFGCNVALSQTNSTKTQNTLHFLKPLSFLDTLCHI
jgi:hypothetical protein